MKLYPRCLPAKVVSVMTETGEPMTSHEIAEALQASPRRMVDVLIGLRKAGKVTRNEKQWQDGKRVGYRFTLPVPQLKPLEVPTEVTTF